MTRIYIGIDPGTHGAIVGVPWDGALPLCPIARRADGPEGYQRGPLKGGITAGLYLAALREVAAGHQVVGVVVEEPSVRPGESASAGQRSGIGVGVWLGLLAALGWPCELAAPRAWRRAAGITVPKGGDPKAATLTVVLRRLPDLDLTPGRITVPHSGIYDAAGLALAAQSRFS